MSATIWRSSASIAARMVASEGSAAVTDPNVVAGTCPPDSWGTTSATRSRSASSRLGSRFTSTSRDLVTRFLTVRGDNAEECWRIVEPVVDAWQEDEVLLD